MKEEHSSSFSSWLPLRPSCDSDSDNGEPLGGKTAKSSSSVRPVVKTPTPPVSKAKGPGLLPLPPKAGINPAPKAALHPRQAFRLLAHPPSFLTVVRSDDLRSRPGPKPRKERHSGLLFTTTVTRTLLGNSTLASPVARCKYAKMFSTSWQHRAPIWWCVSALGPIHIPKTLSCCAGLWFANFRLGQKQAKPD